MNFFSRIPRIALTTVLAGSVSLGILAPATAIEPTAVVASQNLVSLSIKPEAQQKNLWCWVGASTAIANYYGAGVTQNEFCNIAKGNQTTQPCPNVTGDLTDIQNAFRSFDINPGKIQYGSVSFQTIKREIDAKRPVLVRIKFPSGMGHYLVIEGYNAQTGEVQWIDPWGSATRVNVGSYDKFTYNTDYRLTHMVTNIGA